MEPNLGVSYFRGRADSYKERWEPEACKMIISSQQIQSVLKNYGQQLRTGGGARDQEPAAPAPEPDKMTISEAGRTFQLALKAAKEAPEVREAKVAALKQAVADGTYSVPASEIAEKMLGRSLVDRIR